MIPKALSHFTTVHKAFLNIVVFVLLLFIRFKK